MAEVLKLVRPASGIGPNLVLNPGYETPGGGGADVFLNWTENAADGAIVRTVAGGEFYAGVAAAKLTAGPTIATYVSQSLALSPDFSYMLRFYTRGDGANAGRYQVWDNTHAANIIAITSTGVTGAAFAQVTATFTVPAGCVDVHIILRCPAVNAAWACFDEVSVQGNDLDLNTAQGFSTDREGWAPKVARSTPGRIPPYLGEEFAVQLRGTSHDNMAAIMQSLHAMQEGAARYMRDRTEQYPVWLHVKMDGETGERRALVKAIEGEFLSSWLGDWADDKKLDQALVIERHPYWEALAASGIADGVALSVLQATFDYTTGADGNPVGDVPARLYMLSISSGALSGVYRGWLGFRSEAKHPGLAAFVPLWEIELGTMQTDAALAADATASPGGGGNTKVVVDFATVATWIQRAYLRLDDIVLAANIGALHGLYQVLMRAHVDAATTVDVRLVHSYIHNIADPDISIAGPIRRITEVGWAEYDMGILRIPLRDTQTITADIVPFGLDASNIVQVHARRVLGAGSLHIDCLQIIPIDEYSVFPELINAGTAGRPGIAYVVVNPKDDIGSMSIAVAGTGTICGLAQAYGAGIPIGDGRMYGVFAGASDYNRLAETVDLQLQFIPRWSSLRGAE